MGWSNISRVHFISFSLLLTCGEIIHDLLTPDIIHVTYRTKMGYIFLLFRDIDGTGISKYSVNNSAYQVADGLLPCKLMMKSIRIQMTRCSRVNQTTKQRKRRGKCTRALTFDSSKCSTRNVNNSEDCTRFLLHAKIFATYTVKQCHRVLMHLQDRYIVHFPNRCSK